ncbi:MAG: hypothetical protein ACRCTE_12745 [Cellulosilyticaceae bacterium]
MPIPCALNPSKPTVITFVATVPIPIGYILTNPPLYELHLTLDSNHLHTTLTIELKDSIITLNNSDPTNPQTLSCLSKVYKLSLQGSILYNLVIERFQTFKNLDPAKFTAFSSNNIVNVDAELGYSCYECDFLNDINTRYTTDIIKGTEFVITDNASIIPYNPLEPEPFFDALSDPNSSQVIQVPYTLTITPMA